MKAFVKYIAFVLLIILQTNSWAISRVSTGSGPWTTPGTWSPSGLPLAGDDITIAAGHIITMDGNAGSCLSLTIDGEATWTAGRTTNVGVGGIIISATGNITGTGAGVLTTTGNVSINSVLTSTTTRIQIQTTGGQTISGTGSLARLRINATTTNTGDLTVTTSLDGTSTLTNGPGAILNIGNASTISSLDASVNPNTVNYTRGGNQTIKSATYHHLGITNSGTSTLGGNIIVNGNLTVSGGTLALSSYNITGNPTGLLTLAAATNMTIGVTGSIVSNTFPTGFVAANISLNTTSTVAYAANVAQTISTEPPSYGNLTITTGAATAVKSVSGSTLNITRNLTLSSALATLDAGSSTVNITGNISGTGGLSFTSGTLNILGNNSQSGTFTCGTSSVNYQKLTGTQTVRGTTYYDLIISGGGNKNLGANTVVTNDLLISAGIFDVTTSNRSLNIGGDFTNNSTFNRRNGTVVFDGPGLQSIGGSTSTIFYNLTISNTTGVQLTNNQTLSNTMILGAGAIFDVNGQTFTFTSTASNTARIGSSGVGAIFNGDIVWNRYVPGTSPGWVYLGSPVNGVSIANWQDDFPTSGFSGSTGGAGSFVSVFTYDESVAGDINQGYIPPTTSSDPLTPGLGFMAWVADNQTTAANRTVDLIGNPVIGDVPLPVTYNDDPGQPDTEDGWNFICNPYPSEILWSSLLANASDPLMIEDAIYVWNADLNGGTGNNAQYVGGVSSPAVGAGGIGDAIPAGQCFYIHLIGSSTLTATESIKTTSNQVFLRTNQENTLSTQSHQDSIQLFRLYLNGTNFSDEMVIRLSDSTDLNFNQNLDALKLGAYLGTNFIHSHIDSMKYSIKSIPITDSILTIPVSVGVAMSDSVTITTDFLENYHVMGCLKLIDSYTGDTIDLRTQPSYTFYAHDTTWASRFYLKIGTSAIFVTENIICHGQSTGSILFTSIDSTLLTIQIQDTLGNIITQQNGIQNTFLLDQLAAGTYIITSQTSGAIASIQTDTIVITQPDEIIVSFVASVDTLYMDQLDPVWFTNTSSTTENISWDFGDGQGTSIDIDPMYFFDDTGSFDVVLTISGGCGDQTYSQTIVVINPAIFDTLETDTTIIDTLITQIQFPSQLSNDEINLFYHQQTLYFSSTILDKQANCLVYDLHGKIVMPRVNAYQKGSVKLPNLASGMYIAILEMPSGNTFKKFVISDLNR